MSYDIALDKQFIKTKDNRFIPMALIACSNLTEGYGKNERMVRSWSSLTGTQLMTEQELLDYWKEKMDSHMEYYKTGKDNILWGMGFRIQGLSSYDDALNWIKTGCRKAISFEQLGRYSIQFTGYHEYGDKSKVVDGIEPFDIAYSNEERFLEKLNEVDGKFDREKGGLYIHAHWSEDFGKIMRKQYFARNKKQREQKMVDHYFTIVLDGYGYLKRHTARGAKYTNFGPHLKFEDKAKAERLVKKYNEKYSNKYYVEKVDRPATILV